MYDRTYDASDFVFVPSRGFLFFYPVCSFFHFLLVQQVFVPSRGFLFFYCMATFFYILTDPVFVPSRGFLFFYGVCENMKRASLSFSSPHGDFSFSICNLVATSGLRKFSSPHGDFSFSILLHKTIPSLASIVFVPSRGFLFFYEHYNIGYGSCNVFVPSRGFLFFYK